MSSAPNPSTPSVRSLRLNHASVMTPDLDVACAFYEQILGLRLGHVEEDPIRPGKRHALLLDADGQAVLELMELPDMAHPHVPGRGGIHHLGFHLSQDDWHALRARLDARSYEYREVEGRLFVRDADGMVLEIEYA